MKILVTGGSGYIGSFMVRRLIEEGDDVVVVDSLERGHEEVIDQKARLEIGNLQDKQFLNRLFIKNKFDAVIHFAGYISVLESMEKPGDYFENNTMATLILLDTMVKNNVKHIIFSSTAAVYGNPIKVPIEEEHPKNPTSVYGESKLMVEKILKWYAKIYKLNFASLRYFNAAGAALDGSLGEAHNPETHIIPAALVAVMGNLEFTLFGSDWNTPDKTCIRDYIHVLDLVESHMLALRKITSDGKSYFYNVGTGKGYSNKEVIEMVKRITGLELNVKIAERRPGDPEILIADPKKIQTELGFAPKYSDLETIVKSAWEWHKNNSKFNPD